MIRRITTKWLVAVLLTVVVPFVVLTLVTNTQVSDRMSGDVVRYHLLSMAADLADRIDEEIAERTLDVELLAEDSLVVWLVGDYEGDSGIFLDRVQSNFDGIVQKSRVYDLIIAVNAEGRFVVASRKFSDDTPIPAAVIAALVERDYREEAWFQDAMRFGATKVDKHVSELLPQETGPGPDPQDYHIGIAQRIEPRYEQGDEPVGVLFLLMGWEPIQDLVSHYGIRQLSDQRVGGQQPDSVGEDIYESSYAWIWKSDANTILAHPRTELYEQKVTDLGLPDLVKAAQATDFGMYPDYAFGGVSKKAAFKHCKAREEGGFGWVVGVGADDKDIYAPVKALSRLLFTVAALVLALAVIVTVFTAHRMTRPILDLQQHTRRIASGDLDTRIDIRRQDEIGDLADSFNRMTTELKENREQLVKAEKDAAWREMARQVAHEIKNPLTPISISAGLLRRARDEGSKDFDAILDRTIDMIQRQVENMREITRDFYAFAGEHKENVDFDLGPLLDEVLELNAAWALERGVHIHRRGTGGIVHGDPNELRRAFINLVTNALEVMGEGGELFVNVLDEGGAVTVEIRDTGPGLAREVSGRLFEPYFTTRSSGTGLGLAIVRRVIEDMGGKVELANAPDGTGAVARIVLPSHS